VSDVMFKLSSYIPPTAWGQIVVIVVLALLLILPAMRWRRAGWLGLPLGMLLSVASLMIARDVDDRLLLVYWIAIPAIAASRLPRPEVAFGVVVGIAACCAVLFIPAGPDNPLPYVASASALGFTAGAAFAWGFAAARSRRRARAVAHG
jgi:hypothetical protein